MDALPIPDWIRQAPDVLGVNDFHLPDGSGISGPPAGAFLTLEKADNALHPIPMWHLLLEVTDDDLEALAQSRVLLVACTVVPIFMIGPAPYTIDGTYIDQHDTADGEDTSDE